MSLGNPVQGAIDDVNCDGEIDLAAGGSVYLGDGSGSRQLGATVDGADASQLGDLDGDGWLDIVRSYKLRDSGVFGDAGNLNVLEVWTR